MNDSAGIDCVWCELVAEHDRYRALLVRCRAELLILSGYAEIDDPLMKEIREALEGPADA